MPRFNRLSLSLASTAAVALASLPLGITPASAAKVSEGTTSSIGVMETSPNAQQFNLKPEGESTVFISGTGRQTPQTTARVIKIPEGWFLQEVYQRIKALIRIQWV